MIPKLIINGQMVLTLNSLTCSSTWLWYDLLWLYRVPSSKQKTVSKTFTNYFFVIERPKRRLLQLQYTMYIVHIYYIAFKFHLNRLINTYIIITRSKKLSKKSIITNLLLCSTSWPCLVWVWHFYQLGLFHPPYNFRKGLKGRPD